MTIRENINFGFAADSLINGLGLFLILNIINDIFYWFTNYIIFLAINNKLKYYIYKYFKFFSLDWGNNSFTFYGENIQGNATCVCNHISPCEFFIFLNLFHKYGYNENHSFILKDIKNKIVKYLINKYYYICVRNGKENDIEEIKKKANILRVKDKHIICVFPEGTYVDDNTDISKKAVKKSNQLFEINKEKPLNNLLFPKSTGINILYHNFLTKDDKKIYDITLGIENYTPSVNGNHSEIPLFYDFLSKRKQFKFHFDIKKRYVEEDIDFETLLWWWKEKDNKLEYFKENNEFDNIKTPVINQKDYRRDKKYKVLFYILFNFFHYLFMDIILGSYFYMYLLFRFLLLCIIHRECLTNL